MSESRLTSVPIFAAGKHRGKPYSRADLDDMVANFELAREGGRGAPVPLVFGHEEDQRFLERSDTPAAGWVSGLERRGGTLYAHFEHVPAGVMRLLAGRAYRRVSAEVYDDPPDGAPGKGKTLRRVALLGGEVPQIKTLGDIPVPETHSERPTGPARLGAVVLSRTPGRPGSWTAFSEVVEMDREKMLSILAEAGVDTALVTDAVPDDLLAEFVRLCEAHAGEGAEEYDEDAELPEPADDEEKERFAEEARKMLARARKHVEKYCSDDEEHYGEDEDGGEEGGGRKPDPEEKAPMKMSELRKTIAREVAGAVKAAIGEVKTTVSQLERFNEEIDAERKKSGVTALLDRLGREGRVSPRERPFVHDRLMRAQTAKVHKFSEKGKTLTLSDFDLQVRELEARPSRFAEHFADPPEARSGEDDEAAKVEAHFEAYSESFRKVGTTKEDLVGAFKARRKDDPKLTAERFLKV